MNIKTTLKNIFITFISYIYISYDITTINVIQLKYVVRLSNTLSKWSKHRAWFKLCLVIANEWF